MAICDKEGMAVAAGRGGTDDPLRDHASRNVADVHPALIATFSCACIMHHRSRRLTTNRTYLNEIKVAMSGPRTEILPRPHTEDWYPTGPR